MVVSREYLIVGFLVFFCAQSIAFTKVEGTEDFTEFSFSVYAPRPIKDLHFAVFDREGSLVSVQPLQFRSGGRSKSYNYSGPHEIVFFQSKSGVLASALVDPVIVGRAKIPPEIDQALLLFMRSKDSQDPYRIYTIDDSLDAIPWGEIVVYNATSATLKGVLGSKSNDPVNVLPGQNPSIQIAPKGRVSLAYRFRDAHWQLVYSEKLSCDDNERLILIILPPRSQGARQLRGTLIKDYRVP